MLEIPIKDTSLQQSEKDVIQAVNAEHMTIHYRFSFARSPTTAIQDISKKTVERVAGTRLSWWPLSESEEELKEKYTRVYSQPLTSSSIHNRVFYDDIPTSLAEKLFPELVAARNKGIRNALGEAAT